jgi:aminoglycoside phosphotransferase (APT) family kinase protein
MGRGNRPAAEVVIDAPLVQALLVEQHPDLAGLPLADVGEGWDNRVFRLGDDLAVRLPRRALSASLIEHEQRWLPLLAPRLPLPTPVPVRLGRPGCGFLWAWSIVPWLAGESAWSVSTTDAASLAVALGGFVACLHHPADAEAPRNRWRGVPLADRHDVVVARARQLDGHVDTARVLAAWEAIVHTPPWHGPPLWIHGDLHPGNLLVREGRLSAVVDFGDVTAGDPATDLSVAWMLLPPSARPIFRASARAPHAPIDDATWTRARGWALALGLAYVADSRDDDRLATMGRATIEAAIDDWTTTA